MSATANISASTQGAINACKENLRGCVHRFKTTFNAVPEDKLNYTPAPTCKSPLRLAAHVANSNYAFIRIMRNQPLDMSNPEEVAKRMEEAETAINSREEALIALDESVVAVNQALDEITDESINSDIPTPFMTAPMQFWMYLPARHIDNHAAQIDYIQTIWGDMDWHMR